MSLLSQKRALIVGAGGLGAPAALALAAAGVGTLGLADADQVDLSNLHRQILYRTEDIGAPKVERAAARLRALFGQRVRLVPLQQKLSPPEDDALLQNWDVILDGTDSIDTKFALSDAAVRLKIPLVHAGVLRQRGLILTVLPDTGPCYRCLFEEPPPPGENPSCQEAGVLGAAAGLVGALQAAEALKVLTGEGKLLSGRLLSLELDSLRIREVPFPKNPRCKACAS